MNATADQPESQLPPEVSVPAARPEDLPPVEPPSAGFIVQLFLIPALIVAAVIGVWAFFGRLADSETDWKQLTADLGSSNEHRRWRAALGLAQVLRNQQIAETQDGVILAEQPEVAEALAALLRESLASNSTLDDDIRHQEFLARTLGSLSVDDVVLPTLATALDPERNIEVRKSSLMSLAMIAGRHFKAAAGGRDSAAADEKSPGDAESLSAPAEQALIDNADVTKQLLLCAQDEDPSIRHLAAFVLGLVSGPEAIDQLKLMLLDRDDMARANAAVALTRNGLTDGADTLIDLLKSAGSEMVREEFQKLTPEQQQTELKRRQFEEPMILSNALRALNSLHGRLTEAQTSALQPLVQNIAESNPAPDIRMQAQTMLNRAK
ncbi:MAG: HEAT repeat domain-containing protein [Planctomycetaceae bacterium]